MTKFAVLGGIWGTHRLILFSLCVYQIDLNCQVPEHLLKIDFSSLFLFPIFWSHILLFFLCAASTLVCPLGSNFFTLQCAGSNILNDSSTVALLLFATHSMILIYTHKIKIIYDRNWKSALKSRKMILVRNDKYMGEKMQRKCKSPVAAPIFLFSWWAYCM